MDDKSIEIKIAEVVANIEQRTDTELIAILKDVMVAVATGYPIDSLNEQYKSIYGELNRRFESQGIINPNDFEDLWAFHDHWSSEGLDTYASRRSFIRNIYKVQVSSGHLDGVWSNMHPVIVGVAKSRFDSGHFADAVEASFKEINSRIKEEVRQRTGKIYDGADLMNNAFSPKNPVIVLENLESEDGQNIQQGYMMMFAGAMIAIRNPKAHANEFIESDEAMPLIQLASHLFSKFDAAMQRDSANQEEGAEESSGSEHKVYVRMEDPNNHEKLLGLKNLSARYPGEIAIILVLGVGKKSAIRLPFGVSGAKEYINELKKLVGDKNVIKR